MKKIGSIIVDHFSVFMLGILLGSFFVLSIEGVRDYGAVYEIRVNDTTWSTYRLPEYDSRGNWKFRDIKCNCEVLINQGFSIKRID